RMLATDCDSGGHDWRGGDGHSAKGFGEGGDHGRTPAHGARMLLRLGAAIEESRFSRLSGDELNHGEVK
ncbi:hypothetical protein Dimus_035583, partial [Dionaea muscipula]